ncbi:restriction endonuclease [Methylobacter tundripaludum]|uniref:Restriction endonuclease n=1 Tax=Methylobacter tundripaludum TaxID=173365 RepID=A0A2S6GSP4_9GAMM|nr:restriction endonuclease [Methylobacter tundripaludum]PPK68275.1 restriction endonuclease [Methylobacter tundripaludum]
MSDKKEQTIRQYAKASSIPLKQALEDLKSAEFSCNADDVLDQIMRKKLLACFRKRAGTPEAKAKKELKRQEEAKEDAKKQKRKEEEAEEKYKRKLATPEGKIWLLIDLCCELIPDQIANQIADHIIKYYKNAAGKQSFVTVSDIVFSFYSDYIKINPTIDMISAYGLNIYYISINSSVTSEQRKANENEVNNYIKQYHKSINNHIKHNCYTAALIETIYFILNNKKYNFKDLYPVGELLIGMGAIDSALRLYNIDERVFNTPNRLSLLADKAVKSGNFDDSVKLVKKLIEQEPYHPSISTIQAEIKRLEQRHRLKTTFSIDFSKVDELSGVEFENLLMDKFSSLGFKVESTPKTGDFGADLIVENSEGSRIIVQCKRFKSKVNLKAVQEVVGAMGHYTGDMGIVITNNSFLNSAVKLAESHDIELWDGDKLVSFLAGDLSFSETINT